MNFQSFKLNKKKKKLISTIRNFITFHAKKIKKFKNIKLSLQYEL